jgi:hypothetical protein
MIFPPVLPDYDGKLPLRKAKSPSTSGVLSSIGNISTGEGALHIAPQTPPRL